MNKRGVEISLKQIIYFILFAVLAFAFIMAVLAVKNAVLG